MRSEAIHLARHIHQKGPYDAPAIEENVIKELDKEMFQYEEWGQRVRGGKAVRLVKHEREIRRDKKYPIFDIEIYLSLEVSGNVMKNYFKKRKRD